MTDSLKKTSLNLDGSVPLYINLANNLRDFILSDNVAAGDSLPSERELAKLTGASRVTIRKALDQLIDEGILLRRHGAGTFVTPSIEQSGEKLSGFSADAKGRGEAPFSIWLVKSLASATEDEAKHLNLPRLEHVVRLGRVRLSAGEPLAIEHAVVPAALLPDPSVVQESLYRALADAGNPPVSGVQRLRACRASPTEAGLLSIQENGEVIRIERQTYLKDGTPVEYTRSTYRGDKYVFVTELHKCDDENN